MSTSDASVQIGHVTLTVRDLDNTGAFYEGVLGLERQSKDASEAIYGAGGKPLVRLIADAHARQSSRTESGLYHTAFLLPDRADLAAFLDHVVVNQIPMQGASDHAVSEALYTADPEGNGIEIYIDRPRDTWPMKGDEIAMVTDPLDLGDLHAAKRADWSVAPEGTVVGHVHLQVGRLPEAESFWGDTLGFGLMSNYPGAKFFGMDGYHHHVATNVWHSRGAGVKDRPATGLSGLDLLATAEAKQAITARAGSTLIDPWGLPITLTQKEN